MNKKQDLKLVFDFIADFLREDVDTSPLKQAPEKKSSGLDLPKPLDDNTARITELMKRIDDIDKAKASAYRMVNVFDPIQTSFTNHLNELRNEYSASAAEATFAEEKDLPFGEVRKMAEELKHKHEESKDEVKQYLDSKDAEMVKRDFPHIQIPNILSTPITGKYRPKHMQRYGKNNH